MKMRQGDLFPLAGWGSSSVGMRGATCSETMLSSDGGVLVLMIAVGNLLQGTHLQHAPRTHPRTA